MTKRALKFGDYSTASDGWTLSALSLSYPERRSNYVDVPGRDGSLDLSAILSDEPIYGTRELLATLELSAGTRAQRNDLVRKLINAYHGRDVQITLPDDPDHTLTARPTFSIQYHTAAHVAVDINAVCQPWRIAKASKAIIADAAAAALAVQLPNNGSRTEVPEITVTGTADITIVHEASTWTVSPGTHILPDLRIPAGGITCSISGAGQIKFAYEEAIL